MRWYLHHLETRIDTVLRCVPGVQALKKEDEAANAATYACELEKVHARVYHVPVQGRYL